MKVLCTIFIVCLIVAAVNVGGCPDKPCPDGQYCVRVMGTRNCVKAAKQECHNQAISQRSKSVTEPISVLLQVWRTIFAETIQKLMESFSHRVEDVNAAKRGLTS
ncbi:hypothetical protein TNIN_65601 [Trichonephila inaurata madagascariensis]|uniref:Uncharacterized protein n=1 Tax=Trichonephila inaurata madagascariensis TaxID=2747483 RepID=A0A8X7BYC3_9ARAC|nr:hypothetical protein TNIN_65601 [Trichonephila inaurata madagascariensis]